MGSGLLDIRVCQPEHRRAALKLVLKSLPAEQRAPLVEAMTGLGDEPLGAFDALVGAWQRDRLTAAAWAQPQAGKTAAVWAPRFNGTRSAVVARRLLELAMQRVDVAGVPLSQVLVEHPEGSATADLQANGFQRVATLNYLQWNADGANSGSNAAATRAKPEQAAAAQESIRLVPAANVTRPMLEALVSKTYQKTLDCPELEGLRSVRDVLHGYQCSGDSGDRLWRLLELHGQRVGVLLLSEHQPSRQMELTYMGLIPQARGRGLGGQAVAAAQQTTRQRRCQQLVLAVDQRNQPAKRAYRSAGFSAWAQRTVFLRSLPSSHAE